MKIKKFLTISLAIFTIITNFVTISYASESLDPYQVTDEHVVINSVYYDIVNNTIQYDNVMYTIKGYTLITYDENGDKLILPLPVEKTRITDPAEIARLNAKATSPTLYALTSGSVPEGEWYYETETFRNTNFARSINLELTNFSTNDREFQIGFLYQEPNGDWHGNHTTQNFFWNHDMKFTNTSLHSKIFFQLTNLNGSPSPSYDYSAIYGT